MTHMVTIGFVPRERFSLAAEALERIFRLTPEPFRLVVIDCAIPTPYREAMERILAGRDNVEIVRRDEFLYPNHSRNLVIAAAGDCGWICLLDNDVFVEEGWLTGLVRAAEEEGAELAVPLILEGDGAVHFDRRVGRIERLPEGSDGAWRIVRDVDYASDLDAGRRWQDCLEDHCVLYRRAFLERIAPFDERLNTRELIDLSMRVHAAGARVLFVPEVRVLFQPPTTLGPKEREFFSFRWDPERAAASSLAVAERWRIAGLPASHRFVAKRRALLAT